MKHPGRETEIKLPVSSLPAIRRRLRDSGFEVTTKRVFESNTVFDTPTQTFRAAATLVRLREAGRLTTLTYKGTPIEAKHKTREELELHVDDAGAMAAVLSRLGLNPVFRYEKYRTELRRPGQRGTAMLDETPIGNYLELEGSPTWIDRTARRLGFAESDYINSSYGRLYLEWCSAHRCKPGDMRFRGR
jgi:adenylate cyclase class 2